MKREFDSPRNTKASKSFDVCGKFSSLRVKKSRQSRQFLICYTGDCSFWMLRDAVMDPRTMCTIEYSSESSCRIVTRVYCRCSVASRHEKSPPHPGRPCPFRLTQSSSRRVGDVHLDHDVSGKATASPFLPGVKLETSLILYFVYPVCVVVSCEPFSNFLPYSFT